MTLCGGSTEYTIKSKENPDMGKIQDTLKLYDYISAVLFPVVNAHAAVLFGLKQRKKNWGSRSCLLRWQV